MGILFRNRFVIVIIALVGLVYACGGQVQEVKIENTEQECQLLIGAIRASDFKNAVVKGIVDKYEATCSIEVMNVGNVKEITQKTYDVVLLVDGCRAGMRFNGKLKNFLDELTQQNVVVFVTAGDSEWEYSYNGVDAVTSASQDEKTQEVIQEIADKIDGLLQ